MDIRKSWNKTPKINGVSKLLGDSSRVDVFVKEVNRLSDIAAKELKKPTNTKLLQKSLLNDVYSITIFSPRQKEWIDQATIDIT